MKSVTCCSLIALSLAMHPSVAKAQGEIFQGDWYNLDSFTRGCTKLSISGVGTTWLINGWGACSPTDCDWGGTIFYPMTDFASPPLERGFAIWEFGFKTSYLSVMLVGNQLMADAYNIFHDGSGRDYHDVYTMAKGPSLTIASSGPSVVVSWSSSATGFTLQTCTNLSAPVTWTPATNAVTLVNRRFTITDDASIAVRFYRLQKTN